jgi:sn-glycerol 3-phosphate transport system ATP-binding protein
MAYGLKNRKMPKDEIQRLVHDAAEMLELAHLLKRKPKQLSGGQRQRVAMGRAIVRNPKVFLFDEPLSNLDAKLRVQMRLEIKKLQHRLATTSIYVTHDQSEAMTLADKLIVLNKGSVEQVGSPLTIYDQPSSLFVATFIGSPAMNIVDAEVVAEGLWIEGQGQIRLDTRHLQTGAVKLGLRPEHLFVTEEAARFRVEVDVIEALGADLLVYCTMSGEGANHVLILRMEGHSQVSIGDRLGVGFEDRHLHLFEADSGQRITMVPTVAQKKQYA